MFLTRKEVADLTGLKRKGAQRAWLLAQGYVIELDAKGHPKVLRSVVEARLGAVTPQQKQQPNFGALR
jgi:hypothetical protein